MVASQQGEQLARQELDQIKERAGRLQRSCSWIASGLIEQGGDPGQALRQSAQYPGSGKARSAPTSGRISSRGAKPPGARRKTPMGKCICGKRGWCPDRERPLRRAIRRALANRQPVYPTG
jgi:hypothetical protein